MDQEQIKKIIEDTYDDSKEDTPLSMVGQLYSRKMFSSFIVHAAYSSIFIVLAFMYFGLESRLRFSLKVLAFDISFFFLHFPQYSP